MIKIKNIETKNGEITMNEVSIQGTPKSICQDVLSILAYITDEFEEPIKKLVKAMITVWAMSNEDFLTKKTEKEEE